MRSAREMLDADGLEGFSMRRLAAELGVAPMTIYGYFADQDALFDAVVDTFSDSVRRPSRDLLWQEQLRALLMRLHRTLRRHPYLIELRRQRQLISPRALRFCEAIHDVLHAAGVPPTESPWMFRDLFVYTWGHAAFSTPNEQLTRDRQASAAVLAVLPPDGYPAMLAAGPAIVESLDSDASFRHGLTLLIDALERRVSG